MIFTVGQVGFVATKCLRNFRPGKHRRESCSTNCFCFCQVWSRICNIVPQTIKPSCFLLWFKLRFFSPNECGVSVSNLVVAVSNIVPGQTPQPFVSQPLERKTRLHLFHMPPDVSIFQRWPAWFDFWPVAFHDGTSIHKHHWNKTRRLSTQRWNLFSFSGNNPVMVVSLWRCVALGLWYRTASPPHLF